MTRRSKTTTNYHATKEAIVRAVNGEPKVSEVIAKRNQVKHPFAA
jgi:5,6,7,8-tetrahydromethanopterin hydro-lyase